MYVYSISGWPKMYFQVWHQDQFERNKLYSYGFCHIPTSPGMHEIECHTWQPRGSSAETVSQHFLGGGRQCKNPDLIYGTGQRKLLRTNSMGKVHVRLGVILRNFDKLGIECWCHWKWSIWYNDGTIFQILICCLIHKKGWNLTTCLRYHSCGSIQVPSVKNPELSKIPALTSEVGQNIALYSLLTANNSTFLTSAFVLYSALFRNPSDHFLL